MENWLAAEEELRNERRKLATSWPKEKKHFIAAPEGLEKFALGELNHRSTNQPTRLARRISFDFSDGGGNFARFYLI